MVMVLVVVVAWIVIVVVLVVVMIVVVVLQVAAVLLQGGRHSYKLLDTRRVSSQISLSHVTSGGLEVVLEQICSMYLHCCGRRVW